MAGPCETARDEPTQPHSAVAAAKQTSRCMFLLEIVNSFYSNRDCPDGLIPTTTVGVSGDPIAFADIGKLLLDAGLECNKSDGRPTAGRKPHIFWILSDQQWADRTGAAENPRAMLPYHAGSGILHPGHKLGADAGHGHLGNRDIEESQPCRIDSGTSWCCRL